MRRGVTLLAAASQLICGPAQAASKGPLVLAPAGAWAMDYADDSCRLARKFGAGGDSVFFYIERFAPGSSQFMVVAGKPLARLEGRKVGVRFSPDGPIRDKLVFWGKHGEFTPALIAPSVGLVEYPVEAKQARSELGRLARQVPPEREKAIDALDVLVEDKPVVRLALGSMGDPLAAMRKCTDELITHWGLDVEVHRNLTRGPTPLGNPGSWVSHEDYPTEALRKGAQGIIPFRLIIGPDGVPTDCHLQRPTEPPEFNTVVCRILLERARFEPALDAAGKPIKSYWSSTFNFTMG